MTRSTASRRTLVRRSMGFLAVITLLAAVAAAQVNAVYIENNVGQAPNKNTILALKNDGTGKLTPIPPRPALTNGTGVFSNPAVLGPSFQSDGQVVVNSAGTLLFAVNGGSDTISVFSIGSTGALTLLNTTPTPSGGSDPVSLALDENSAAGPFLMVVNQAADPAEPGQTPSVTGFRVDMTTGALTQVPLATTAYPTGSVPSQVLASPSGKFSFVNQFMGGGNFCSFSVGAAGKLNPNNCFGPSVGTVFLGVALHPKQRAAYVGMPGSNMISVFTFNTAGLLDFQKLAGNTGSLICWLTTNKAGTRLYTSESGSNTVSVYDISGANFTNPQTLQHFTLTGGIAPANLKLDPTEKFLYVLGLNEDGVTGNFLHVLNVATDGTLTETQAALKLNIHAGEVPMGMAVVMK